MANKFTRTKENFICKHCKAKVKGNGYTNHCPHCLWSRHVDVNPGDRQEACGGMMRPTYLEKTAREYRLTHECKQCGQKNSCKTSPDDNIEVLIKLSESLAKKVMF